MINFIRETQTPERHLSPNPTLNALSKKQHLKNTRIYLILIVLSGLFVLTALYFDVFQHRKSLSAVQETRRQWNSLFADSSQLLDLAADVYEPSYEELKLRGSVSVAEKMRPATSVFYTRLTALQENLRLESAQFYYTQMFPRLASIRTSMHALEIAIDKINAGFRHNQSGIDFGEQITLKDKYQEIRAGLYLLRGDITMIQNTLLSEEYKAGIGSHIKTCLLMFLTFILITGSICFGFRITRQANLFANTAQHSAEEFAALYETSMALSMQQDLFSLLKAIAKHAKRLLNTSDAVVFLFDERRGYLEVVVSDSIPIGSRLLMGEGIAGTVAQTREPLIVNNYNAWRHPSGRYQDHNVSAVVGVPMLYCGRLLGVLGVDEIVDGARKFTDADARLLSLFAGQAAAAVRNAALLKNSQESEERFRIAAECASDFIYEWNVVNDRLEYFGSLPEVSRTVGVRLPGTRQEMNDGIYSDDQTRILAARESHLLTGNPFSEEYRIMRSDGMQMYVSDRSQVIRDIDGCPIKIIGALTDISERKHTENMKSDFVSFVAHQLRTPLTGVKWMLDLAIENSENFEAVRSYILDAMTSTDRLIHLVNDMLDIARLERGSVYIERSEVDLSELTRSVLLEMSPMILEKKLNLSFQAADDAPKPSADSQLLRQVIMNLASNAAKYTPVGGEISICLYSDEAQVRWEIKDNGMGIPKFDQQKLFQKFYRAGNALAVETEGTGLGLYFVRMIVERHGGRIWYESEEGAGSTFQFSIPVIAMPQRVKMDIGNAEPLALRIA
jgi:signal transduction histidine kinase